MIIGYTKLENFGGIKAAFTKTPIINKININLKNDLVQNALNSMTGSSFKLNNDNAVLFNGSNFNLETTQTGQFAIKVKAFNTELASHVFSISP